MNKAILFLHVFVNSVDIFVVDITYLKITSVLKDN